MKTKNYEIIKILICKKIDFWKYRSDIITCDEIIMLSHLQEILENIAELHKVENSIYKCDCENIAQGD